MTGIDSGRRRLTRAALAVASVAAFGALAGCKAQGDAPPAFRGIDITGAPFGQALELHDVNGALRTLDDFHGQVVMVFFGFAQCPDVCPTALTRAVEVKRLLGENASRLDVLFVTVDPERDTPEVLKAYLAAFDPEFIALRGTAEELEKAAREFKVFYAKVPTEGSYTMDHTATTYVFDASGKLRVALQHSQSAEDYAHDVALLMDEVCTTAPGSDPVSPTASSETSR